MSLSLPPRPSLEWLKKTAKQTLDRLREKDPSKRLADVQLAVAREYGFESWRQLRRHVEQIERAFSADLPPNRHWVDDEAVGAFLRLIGQGQVDEVRRILAANPEIVHPTGPHPFWGGRPQALHVAIETNQQEIFHLLLEAGADVNGTNDRYDQWSPLMVAIHGNRREMRAELLRRGARIGLIEALLLADDARVAELLQPGASALPTQAPNEGSILNFARTPYAIDRLIELGAASDVEDRWGVTPIDSMSRLGPDGGPLVRHLVARGATAAAEQYAKLGDQATLAAMLEKDAGIVRREAVIVGAAEFGHHALVEWLLSHGANVNARATGAARQTVLHTAAWNGDLPMVKLLVGGGADIAARDEEHNGTALDWARTAITIKRNLTCHAVVEYLADCER